MEEEKEQLGKDLKLRFDSSGADLIVQPKGDFDIISEEDNLAQAIIARLSTDEGELYDIGHANYGSRLHDVIGQVNNAETRNQIKSIVEDCLVQETRIKQVANVSVLQNPNDPHAVDIEISIIPIRGSETITIFFPYSLE